MDTSGFLHLGDWRHPEFQQIAAILGAHDGSPHWSIHTIVFYQTRPGEFAQTQIEVVHKTHPLANLVMVLGSWCEGEMRNGPPVRGVERVFWYEAAAFFVSSISMPARRTLSSPESVSRFARANFVVLGAPRATIITANRLSFESLSDGLQLLGFATHWERSISTSDSCELVVWDATRHEPLANNAYATGIAKSLGDSPRIALSIFRDSIKQIAFAN